MNYFDTSTAPKLMPRSIVRGDYAAWRNTDIAATYAPAGHSLVYEFRLEGDPARKKTLTASADNGSYLFELTSAVSADYDAGTYHFDLYLTETASGKRVTIDQGTLRLLANKADDADDPRNFPRKMLAEIRRALLHRATSNQLDTLAYSVGVETSATRDPMKLRQLEQAYRAELIKANRQWRARHGRPSSRKIKYSL